MLFLAAGMMQAQEQIVHTWSVQVDDVDHITDSWFTRNGNRLEVRINQPILSCKDAPKVTAVDKKSARVLTLDCHQSRHEFIYHGMLNFGVSVVVVEFNAYAQGLVYSVLVQEIGEPVKLLGY